MEEIVKEAVGTEYTFDDIVQAAMSDESWDLPEELRWPLFGVDAMMVIV